MKKLFKKISEVFLGFIKIFAALFAFKNSAEDKKSDLLYIESDAAAMGDKEFKETKNYAENVYAEKLHINKEKNLFAFPENAGKRILLGIYVKGGGPFKVIIPEYFHRPDT